MSPPLRYALLGDGGKDAALLHVIGWTLRSVMPSIELDQPAAFRKRRGELSRAVAEAIDELRPDILVVHRDAERVSLRDRLAEIPTEPGCVVRLVPVRMTETWFLLDESAFRHAAGNDNGVDALDLPEVDRLEGVSDPKSALTRAYLAASGNPTGRRRKKVQRDQAAWAERVASAIDDYSPLRRLHAFQAFENELRLRLKEWRESASA